MGTLSGAIARLTGQGFTAHFAVVGNRLRAFERGETFAAKEVVIREYERFEGVSDPDDMSIVYAIESVSGTRGSLVDAFGVYSDPAVSAFLKDVPISRDATPEDLRAAPKVIKAPDGRPTVVIIGAGFAGLHAARALRDAPVTVLVIDRTNHHVFQPLLYQVATAVLAPSDITSPIRHLLRDQRNTTVLLAEAHEVDVERRVVKADTPPRELPYQYLILAAGARHSYFGREEWEPLAPGLKSIADAREMRGRFLLAFEEAEKSDDPGARDAYLTFVIVGAGPTGVELAGVLPEVARNALHRDFRRIDTRRTRVVLLEAGSRVLPTFPETLSDRARRDLEGLGVEVRTGARVTHVAPDAIHIGDERLPTRTVFWAAGNAASPLGRWLGAPLDRAGRVIVEPDLSVPGRPEVFVVGDLAAFKQPDGTWVPGVATAAMQQGRTAGANVFRSLRGEPRLPFRYRDKGNLATIGRHKAVADFGTVRIGGYLAWFLWLFVHIVYLVGFRNRVSVLVEWAYAYFTYQRGARLIGEPSLGAGSIRRPRDGDEREAESRFTGPRGGPPP